MLFHIIATCITIQKKKNMPLPTTTATYIILLIIIINKIKRKQTYLCSEPTMESIRPKWHIAQKLSSYFCESHAATLFLMNDPPLRPKRKRKSY